MIPRTLGEWTFNAVASLLQKGAHESDLFDFKHGLPHGGDVEGKERLKKTIAAFANSVDGGFLVFGIADDRTLPLENRIEGLEPTIDFPQQFGTFPRLCTPAVEWEFANPPIALNSGKVLHVIEIPRSWRAPHAVGDPTRWVFPKRTNRGNDEMSYQEVQTMFLGFYEKRLKLQLLRAELVDLLDQVTKMDAWARSPNQGYEVFTFDPFVTESILCDTYSITSASPDLLRSLREIRRNARLITHSSNVLHQEITLGRFASNSFGLQGFVEKHNHFIGAPCAHIATLVSEAIPCIDQLLA